MLPEITDEFMQQMRATTKNYTLLILRLGPEFVLPGVEKIIWEHGRRNYEVKKIMDEDPGVKQGIFLYELHPCRSFPGDKLP